MMRIAIFTQDERIYLPGSIATVVEAMPEKVSSIVVSPPMSTHGGAIKGLLKHLPVFGLKGTLVMGWRTVMARIGPRLGLRPGAPAGRRYWSIFEVGERFGIPTFEVDKVNSDEMHRILDEHPADLLVSVSCPQIVRGKLLKRFAHGGINVHSAPLPKYRGLMPGFWILQNDEKETAVTVHDLAERLDNGDILVQRPIEVTRDDTWDSLIGKTKQAAGHALVEAIGEIESGTAKRRPNRDEESTYFSFPTWKDARLFRKRGRRMF
jgi:methionyl-tRNA formyltransferase